MKLSSINAAAFWLQIDSVCNNLTSQFVTRHRLTLKNQPDRWKLSLRRVFDHSTGENLIALLPRSDFFPGWGRRGGTHNPPISFALLLFYPSSKKKEEGEGPRRDFIKVRSWISNLKTGLVSGGERREKFPLSLLLENEWEKM